MKGLQQADGQYLMDHMKIVKRMISIAAVLTFFIIGCKFLNYILVNDVRVSSRVMMHEFYNQDNIDVLFVGPSRSQRGIDAPLVSELTGKKVFVAATSAQYLDASLTLVREAAEKYDVREVFLELSDGIAKNYGPPAERTGTSFTNIISDFMPLSLNKIKFILQASVPEHWINSFWPARRHWQKIASPYYIKDIIQNKSTDDYKNYAYTLVNYNAKIQYQGNGYIADKRTVKPNSYFQNFYGSNKRLDIDAIPSYWKDKVIEVIDFCRDHNIKLTLYAMPASNYYLSIIRDDYDGYIAFIKDLIRDRDVEFLDFNTLSVEYFPFVQTNYKDAEHLNYQGAEVFSNFIARYINGEISDDAFYSSVKEKLEKSEPDYYGINYSRNNKKKIETLNLISNIPGAFEYKVELASDTGDMTLIQDYDINQVITIPLDVWKMNNQVIVTFREAASEEEGNRVVRKY